MLKGKGDGTLLTEKDLEELGIRFEKPERQRCRFCGKELEPLGVLFMGEVKWVATKSCECDGAKEEARRQQLQQAKQKQAAAAEKVERAGVKPRFASAITSNDQVVEYLSGDSMERGMGLYIHGRVGSGKTHMASALARALVYEGYSVVMTTALDMLDSVKSSYDDSFSSDGTSKFRSCDVLVVDDLGKEGATSWALTTLFQIVNSRYESLKPTVFTSQYDLDALGRRMSRGGERESAEAIVSRIQETCEVVETGDVDWRRRGKQS